MKTLTIKIGSKNIQTFEIKCPGIKTLQANSLPPIMLSTEKLEPMPDKKSCVMHPKAIINIPPEFLGAGSSVGRAVIGSDVEIDEGCFISDGVTIGPGCRLGKWVVVGPNTIIGANTIIENGVVLYGDNKINVEQDTVPHDLNSASSGTGRYFHIGAFTIIGEKNHFVGQFAIGTSVWVGRNNKFDSRISLGDRSVLGDRNHLAHSVVVKNDVEIGSENNLAPMANLGAGTKVNDGAVIGSGVHLGAGSQIAHGAEIADYALLGQKVTVGQEACIGAETEIVAGSTIGPHAIIEEDVRIYVPHQLPNGIKIKAGQIIADRSLSLAAVHAC